MLVESTTFADIDTLILYSRFYDLQLAYIQFPRISNKTSTNGGGSGNMSYWDTPNGQSSSSARSFKNVGGNLVWVLVSIVTSIIML